MKGSYMIVVAAGSGARMGAKVNKVLMRLGHATVLGHSLKAIFKSRCFENVLIVCRTEERPRIDQIAKGALKKGYTLVDGGKERQDSVHNALNLIPESALIIAVHDAARCFLDEKLIRRCVESAQKYGTGIAGRKSVDTVKIISEGKITKTLNRDSVALIETPQAFDAQLLKKAYEKAYEDGFYGTDDAMLVERMGIEPRFVESSPGNVKLTNLNDLEYGRFIFSKRQVERIGQGFDVHAFQEGRDLILGGVKIPYEKGLLGHSDADVLVHAVMDSLLGAAGFADIGRCFPDTDEKYKDINSLILLKKVGEMLVRANCHINNIDVTLMMEQPKIAGYIGEMKKNIADALFICADNINIKATTLEGLGFVGRSEGVAALAGSMITKGMYDEL
jgi:2-C-methyl-D-erythritol 4-phosphate cytidylyltransferase/2-C-methyl-D-erythritol 2,4-cyclodiphosphate synthase